MKEQIEFREEKIDPIIKTWLCKTVCEKRETCPNASEEGEHRDTSKGFICGAFVGLSVDLISIIPDAIEKDKDELWNQWIERMGPLEKINEWIDNKCSQQVDQIYKLKEQVKKAKEEISTHIEDNEALAAEIEALTECLNGSSKAVYTAEMYDKIRDENSKLKTELGMLSTEPQRYKEYNKECAEKITELEQSLQTHIVLLEEREAEGTSLKTELAKSYGVNEILNTHKTNLIESLKRLNKRNKELLEDWRKLKGHHND